MSNPSTLITRFYGLYSIKPHKNKSNSVRFIVMNNVFDTPFKIDRRWDLKGSTVGREADEKELSRETPIYKDLDIMKQKKKILIGPEAKVRLLKQLKADCEWLAKIGIMDYSLLLGVHTCDKTDQSDILEDGDEAYAKMMKLNDQIQEEAKKMEMERVQRETNMDLKGIEKQMSERHIHEYSPRVTTMDLQGPSFRESNEMLKVLQQNESTEKLKAKNEFKLERDPSITELSSPPTIVIQKAQNKNDNGTRDLTQLGLEMKSQELKDLIRVNSDRRDESDSSSDSPLSMSPRHQSDDHMKPPTLVPRVSEQIKNPVRNSMLSIFNPLSKRLSLMMGTTKKDKDQLVILKSIGPNRLSEFQRIHGGTLSLLDPETGKREIYYLGIIDLLQKWNEKKKLESFFKGFSYDKMEISAVDPKTYSKRFYDFVEKLIE